MRRTLDINKLAEEWKEEQKRDAEKREAELKVEHEAGTAYFEKTGRGMHLLTPTERRKVIEAYTEDHDLHF